MKKLIFTLLATILCLSVMYGCSAEVKENPASDFEYKKSEDGDSILITKYVGASENVVIPAEIDGLPVSKILGVAGEKTVIGTFENSNVKSVVIPDSVTSIGSNAFKNCSSLTKVKMPENLKTIGYNSFENCTSLKNIDMSETALTQLGNSAFMDCTSLGEVKLPDTLETIYEKAFYNCSSLKEIRLPESLRIVYYEAFSNCTALKVITVSKTANLFGSVSPAISDIPALEKIIFEDGRTEISGYGIFSTTSDVEVIIPASVKKLDPRVFFNYGTMTLIFEGECPDVGDGEKHSGATSAKIITEKNVNPPTSTIVFE